MMTSLVGVGGLAAEFGNGLLNRVENQRIADTAAVAGAVVYGETQSSTAMATAVSQSVALNSASVTVSSQIVSSPTADGNQAVQVTVHSSIPIALARLIWHQDSLPVSA